MPPIRPATALPHEPCISLPTRRLLLVIMFAAGSAAVIWASAMTMGNRVGPDRVAGVVGPVAVGLIAIAGVLILMPWRTRPVSMWVSMVMAVTVVRLLATAVATYLLYSAAHLPATPLALAVASTYLVVLLAEAAVLARHVNRVARPSMSS